MYSQDSLSIVPTKILNISLVGMETEPRFTFSMKQIISTTNNTINDNLYDLDSDNYSNGLKKYVS